MQHLLRSNSLRSDERKVILPLNSRNSNKSEKEYVRMRKWIQNQDNFQNKMQALFLTTKKLIVSTHGVSSFLSPVATEFVHLTSL